MNLQPGDETCMAEREREREREREKERERERNEGTCFLRTDRDEDRQNVSKREIQGVEGERRREPCMTIHRERHRERERENRDNPNFWLPWQKFTSCHHFPLKAFRRTHAACHRGLFLSMSPYASLALCQLRSKETREQIISSVYTLSWACAVFGRSGA